MTFARLNDPADPASAVEFLGSPSCLFDLWFGYRTSMASNKYKLEFRLNIGNLFDKDDYKIIATDGTGTPMRGRFITPRSFAFTTNITF